MRILEYIDAVSSDARVARMVAETLMTCGLEVTRRMPTGAVGSVLEQEIPRICAHHRMSLECEETLRLAVTLLPPALRGLKGFWRNDGWDGSVACAP
jgi:hypothetical protein